MSEWWDSENKNCMPGDSRCCLGAKWRLRRLSTEEIDQPPGSAKKVLDSEISQSHLHAVNGLYCVQVGHFFQDLVGLVRLQMPNEVPLNIVRKFRCLLHQLLSKTRELACLTYMLYHLSLTTPRCFSFYSILTEIPQIFYLSPFDSRGVRRRATRLGSTFRDVPGALFVSR